MALINIRRRLYWIGSASAFLLGSLGLTANYSGLRNFSTFGLPYAPMAMFVGMLFCALTLALWSLGAGQPSLLRRIAVRILTVGIAAVATLAVWEFLTGWGFGLDMLMVRDESGLPAQRVSPITAGGLCLLSASIFLLTVRAARIHWRQIAAAIACFVLAVDGVVLLGYLYGSPLLYGGTLVPVAPASALAFLGLTVAIMARAGSDLWPLRLLLEPSASGTLVRTFVPIPVIAVMLNGLFHKLFPGHWNPALLAAISGMALGGLLVLLVSRAALKVGGAIDRAEFEREQAENALRRAHQDLKQTYDTTLEGWSRAMDLRDQVTEGHCRRVAEVSVILGRAMGLSEETLVHLRRGALLHDIGKMALPDRILFKTEALTEAEWPIMKLHPEWGYRLLEPIEYLRPALDVPYCHHERWDGSGYPRGLKGEAIPLIARIFTVVDIWDALMSRRPYHEPWSEAEVRSHLRRLAGIHLDPRIVEVFLRLDLPAHEHHHAPAHPVAENGHATTAHPEKIIEGYTV